MNCQHKLPRAPVEVTQLNGTNLRSGVYAMPPWINNCAFNSTACGPDGAGVVPALFEIIAHILNFTQTYLTVDDFIEEHPTLRMNLSHREALSQMMIEGRIDITASLMEMDKITPCIRYSPGITYYRRAFLVRKVLVFKPNFLLNRPFSRPVWLCIYTCIPLILSTLVLSAKVLQEPWPACSTLHNFWTIMGSIVKPIPPNRRPTFVSQRILLTVWGYCKAILLALYGILLVDIIQNAHRDVTQVDVRFYNSTELEELIRLKQYQLVIINEHNYWTETSDYEDSQRIQGILKDNPPLNVRSLNQAIQMVVNSSRKDLVVSSSSSVLKIMLASLDLDENATLIEDQNDFNKFLAFAYAPSFLYAEQFNRLLVSYEFLVSFKAGTIESELYTYLQRPDTMKRLKEQENAKKSNKPKAEVKDDNGTIDITGDENTDAVKIKSHATGQSTGTNRTDKIDAFGKLSFSQMQGSFWILIIGLICGSCQLVVERYWTERRRAREVVPMGKVVIYRRKHAVAGPVPKILPYALAKLSLTRRAVNTRRFARRHAKFVNRRAMRLSTKVRSRLKTKTSAQGCDVATQTMY